MKLDYAINIVNLCLVNINSNADNTEFICPLKHAAIDVPYETGSIYALFCNEWKIHKFG